MQLNRFQQYYFHYGILSYANIEAAATPSRSKLQIEVAECTKESFGMLPTVAMTAQWIGRAPTHVKKQRNENHEKVKQKGKVSLPLMPERLLFFLQFFLYKYDHKIEAFHSVTKMKPKLHQIWRIEVYMKPPGLKSKVLICPRNVHYYATDSSYEVKEAADILAHWHRLRFHYKYMILKKEHIFCSVNQ